jgi:hypothetical protein
VDKGGVSVFVLIIIFVENEISGANRKHIKVTGILYLHNMTDNRLTEPLLPYEVFRKLCGSDSLAASVLFVLTMCEKVTPETCQNRREYLTNHWKKMMGEKAAVYSHYGTKQSAWDAVTALGVL